MPQPAQQDGINRAQRIIPAGSVPAPIGGWNTRDPLAAMAPTDAPLIENWIVRPGRVDMRRGQEDWSTEYPSTEIVETLMPWYGPSDSVMFSATGSGIYDATAAGPVGAVSSAATNGRWQYTNFTNSAGAFLCAVNGVDDYRYFDGATWATQPTFVYDMSTLNTSELINIVGYKGRIYFARLGDLAFYYLPPEQINTGSGTLNRFNLGSVCQRGGSLTAMATWTIDGGAGTDDFIAFITSQGEVVVYTGYDPSDVTNWSLVGVYFIGKPLGRRCWFKYGGDVLLLTDRGLFPLSKALQTASIDRSVAITDKIAPTFSSAASLYGSTFGWQIESHLAESFIFVNVPGLPTSQFVMDVNSGGWSPFTGMDASCWLFFNGSIYYGTTEKVVHAWTGTSDFGTNIRTAVQWAYNYLGDRGALKHIALMRPHFSASGPFSYKLSLATDFRPANSSSSYVTAGVVGGVWDSSFWDDAFWSSTGTNYAQWNTVFNSPGMAQSPLLTMASKTISASLISLDIAYKRGGLL